MQAGASRRLVPALVVALFAGGCAGTAALRRGSEAEQRQDYDLAVAEYTKDLRVHPNDTTVRLALDRAKLRASTDHVQAGRRMAATEIGRASCRERV